MEEVTWTISGPNGSQPAVKQMPHAPEVAVTDEMSSGSKEFARIYNEMRVKLIENGLMKKK